MSTNTDTNTKRPELKEEITNFKKSILGEVSAVSGLILAGIVALVIFSIASFIYMNRIPPKSVTILDEAGIFNAKEEKRLKKLADDLMDDHDINVVIATTRNNKHGLDDDDCKDNASEYYKDNCISTSMQDNSGICLYIDLTQDKPGYRFFWLYTYGTAYYTVDDDKCQRLFGKYKSELQDEDYFEAISSILEDLDDYDYHSTGLVVTYGCSMIIPLLLAALITFLCTKKQSLDLAPGSAQYIVRKKCNVIENTDVFLRKSTRVYHTSSGGGGGGGGGHGGGGGGGHSGGGGGRF